MNLASLSAADLAGTLIGFVLTLMVFSYIFGDNPLFRIGISIFIGVASGYALIIAVYQVIWPQLILPLLNGTQSDRLLLSVPLLLSGLLLLKISPRLAGWGNITLAYLVGVGVATAIGGAILGTLFPQIGATINYFGTENLPGGPNFFVQLAEGGVIVAGTVTTLIYFQFSTFSRKEQTGHQSRWIEILALIGKIFIAVALGALFAGALMASLAALVERLTFLADFLLSLV